MNTTNRITFDSDRAMHLLGVPGRLTHRTVKPGQAGGLWFKQRWVSNPRPAGDDYPAGSTIKAGVSFDDECGNGHNSFAITATVTNPRRRNDHEACGCLHDDVARVFPELAGLIKWHLVATNGPMHYIANTVYHASDRDHNGKRKGEPYAWSQGIRFGNSPVTVKLGDSFAHWLKAAMEFREHTPKSNPNRPSLHVVEVPHTSDGDYKFQPKYTLGEFGGGEWHKCPFGTRQEADEFEAGLLGSYVFTKTPTLISKGKARNLAAARSCAVWPDATDEQLCLPKDELAQLLEARLPALLVDFRAVMTECGLFWSPEEWEAAQ